MDIGVASVGGLSPYRLKASRLLVTLLSDKCIECLGSLCEQNLHTTYISVRETAFALEDVNHLILGRDDEGDVAIEWDLL
jgi:hypothetical protein